MIDNDFVEIFFSIVSSIIASIVWFFVMMCTAALPVVALFWLVSHF